MSWVSVSSPLLLEPLALDVESEIAEVALVALVWLVLGVRSLISEVSRSAAEEIGVIDTVTSLSRTKCAAKHHADHKILLYRPTRDDSSIAPQSFFYNYRFP
jgi:hypothetical protein